LRSRQEDDAFESLVNRQSRFVFRVAYALLRNPHDAEDVAQETFMTLYRTGAWRDIKEERAFLARAAWRQAIDRIRARPQHGEEDVDAALKLTANESSPEDNLLTADSYATIQRLIDALPEELRQPLALSSVNELNSREIAEILRIPEGTVRTRLMRARQMLRQKLSAQMEHRYAK
jgi:RNA polymerase sigma-70 factor (ECF subfamily)